MAKAGMLRTMTQRVFVDANIIVSKTIFDWLFHLRCLNDGMFQLHSTNDVFVEALRNVRKNNPRASSDLIDRRLEMIKDCIDETLEYFPSTVPFTGNHENDYHVHAAAVTLRSDILLTDNKVSDFTTHPEDEPYEVYTADDFFMLVIGSHPECLLPATRSQFSYWKNRPNSRPLVDALQSSGCNQFAEQVRGALQTIALE